MKSRTRRIIKLLLLLLVFSGIVPFVYPWGRPLLTLDGVSLPKLKEIESKLPDVKLPRLDDHGNQTVTVYRWRNKNGNWSFGSEPPAGVKYDAISVNPDANLIQGMQQDDEKKNDTTQVFPSPGDTKSPSVMGYTAEDVSKIMQSAKEARTALQNRYKQEQVIIENQ